MLSGLSTAFFVCHDQSALAAVASSVVFFFLHIDNSGSLRHKNGQKKLIYRLIMFKKSMLENVGVDFFRKLNQAFYVLCFACTFLQLHGVIMISMTVRRAAVCDFDV